VVVRVDRVAALATACANAPLATESELRTHDAITSRIHSASPSLPSRFGQLFNDEGALTSALKERETSLMSTLSNVGDRVELSVTLRWRSPRAPSDEAAVKNSTSGTEYLAARAARERDKQQADQIVARLIEQLPCERAFARHRSCPRDGVAAIVALLVARDEVEAMRTHIESFGKRSSEVTATIHGPLPPYSFAS
jgi:gas vesicle protein GvpL/GvpF